MGRSATAAVPRRLPRGRRLLRPTDYEAVRTAKPDVSIRATQLWLAMTARWAATDRPSVRLGLTISRKMARRAVDRALVKRVVREAFRHRCDDLLRRATQAGHHVDVVMRLKRAVASTQTPDRPSQTQWRRELRENADALLATLQARLDRIAANA